MSRKLQIGAIVLLAIFLLGCDGGSVVNHQNENPTKAAARKDKQGD
jgi:uncharacterized membrane protein